MFFQNYQKRSCRWRSVPRRLCSGVDSWSTSCDFDFVSILCRLSTACHFCVDSMSTLCRLRLYVDSMPTLCALRIHVDSMMSTLCRLCVDSVSTFFFFCVDFASTWCQLGVSLVSAWCQLGVSSDLHLLSILGRLSVGFESMLILCRRCVELVRGSCVDFVLGLDLLSVL